MHIKGTLMDCPSSPVILRQVNVIPIFQKRFLRSREAQGIDKPLSCLVHVGLHALETFLKCIFIGNRTATSLALVQTPYICRCYIYTEQSHLFPHFGLPTTLCANTDPILPVEILSGEGSLELG